MKAAFRRELGAADLETGTASNNIFSNPHFYRIVGHYLREYGEAKQFTRCGWPVAGPGVDMHAELHQLLHGSDPRSSSPAAGRAAQ